MSTLVTRPEPGASRTLAALTAMGKPALAAPLFEIVLTAQPRPSGRFAALLVTSQNGAAGLSPASSGLAADLPVFAVGDRTAQALRDAGFTDVTSASGDQKALTRLVLARLSTRYRVLLATGEDHKDDGFEQHILGLAEEVEKKHIRQFRNQEKEVGMGIHFACGVLGEAVFIVHHSYHKSHDTKD